MENVLENLGFKPDTILLTGSGTQAIDKLKGVFAIQVLNESTISTLQCSNTQNDIDFVNLVLPAGITIFVSPTTVKLTNSTDAVLLYVDPRTNK